MSFLAFRIALSVFLLVYLPCLLADNESITSRDSGYRDVCQKASESEDYFLRFRSITDYRRAAPKNLHKSTHSGLSDMCGPVDTLIEQCY